MDKYILRAIRDKFGWTQADFAEKLRLTKTSVAQVESGARNVGTRMRFRIAQVCDITLDILEAADRAREVDRILNQQK